MPEPLQIEGWVFRCAGEPMELAERSAKPGPGEVAVEVAGCGVCHTDLGFFYEGVPTRHPLPLILGHEVSGTVTAAGDGAEEWIGRRVVVPAVIPCGECAACRAGHGSICPRQVFPGNDVHGGFASHLVVPARGLCPVPDLDDRAVNPRRLDLGVLAVIADAVSTPYQALLRAEVEPGDLAVFVGAGGVGGFGVQIAAAKGAHVIAIDLLSDRLDPLSNHGAELTLDAAELGFKELKQRLRAHASTLEIPSWRWKVFETSGSASGQSTAFGLLGPGSYLGVVGYTPHKVELRLSNLMALDATVQGNWGCLPEHYPAAIELALSGAVALEPFIERRPLSSINETFADLRGGRTSRRPILLPDG